MTPTTHGPDLRLLLSHRNHASPSSPSFPSHSVLIFLDSSAGGAQADYVSLAGLEPVHSFFTIYPRPSAYIICHQHSIDLTHILFFLVRFSKIKKRCLVCIYSAHCAVAHWWVAVELLRNTYLISQTTSTLNVHCFVNLNLTFYFVT